MKLVLHQNLGGDGRGQWWAPSPPLNWVLGVVVTCHRMWAGRQCHPSEWGRKTEGHPSEWGRKTEGGSWSCLWELPLLIDPAGKRDMRIYKCSSRREWWCFGMETVVRSIAQLRYEELRKTESNKKALIQTRARPLRLPTLWAFPETLDWELRDLSPSWPCWVTIIRSLPLSEGNTNNEIASLFPTKVYWADSLHWNCIVAFQGGSKELPVLQSFMSQHRKNSVRSKVMDEKWFLRIEQL